MSAVQMSAILDKFPSFRLVLEFVKEPSWCQHKYDAFSVSLVLILLANLLLRFLKDVFFITFVGLSSVNEI